MDDFFNTPEAALRWIDEGKGAALATVIQTWGSAPRKVGSQLAVSSESEIYGSVSGGCVEGAVVVEAVQALGDGKCRVLEFGVSNIEAFSVGLACGGTIRVMVEPVGTGAGPDVKTIEEMCAARSERKTIACRVNLKSWERRLERPESNGDRRRNVRAESRIEGDEFVLVHNPPLKLVVIGAVHIAQPLLRMARLAEFTTVLIDPRDTFATKDRFPEETILDEWPDDALAVVGLDAHTAVVTLTHDPKLDDPAIAAALESDVFYLGCLGSRRTHKKRVVRLAEAGIPLDAIDRRIHAPVGFGIGASSPAEIAISIMAEIIARLRGKENRT